MRISVSSKASYCVQHWRQIACFLAWTAGLFLGVFLANHVHENYYLLMRMAAKSRVSIVGLLTSAALPFLFLFYFAYIRRFWPIITICFLKGFLFCFGAAAVSIAFGSAGWLVRLLLQFTDVCLIPVFSWLVLRHCSAGARPLQKDAVICGTLVVLICSLDYCVVSPYLAMLIEI